MDFGKFRQYCVENKIPLIREQSGKLLYEVTKSKRPKVVLEIGTGYGFSACIMLSACRPHIYTVDIDETRQAQARKMIADFGYAQSMTFFCGDALEIVQKSLGKFDMIFLDGAKSQYLDLLPYLIDLLAEKGALVCDNINYMGLVPIVNTLPNNHKHITIARKMAEFVEKIKTDKRLATTIYNIEDGMSVSYLI